MSGKITAIYVLLTSTYMATFAQTCTRCIHGTCNAGVCVCDSGYEGPACNTNINNCHGVTACGEHGRCIDGLNTYTCLCKRGYEGAFCNTHTGCKINNCQNGGTCSPEPENPEDHFCTCAAGYQGEHCEVASSSGNLAHAKLAGVWGSSDGWSGRHEFAVDNQITNAHGTNGIYCSHTADGDNNPFLEVFLDKEYPVKTVTVYNRIDGGQGNRFKNITVTVDGVFCAYWNKPDSEMYYKEIIDMYCPDGMKGRRIRISKGNGQYLAICELQVSPNVITH